jgi:hypothetical protein
VVWGNLGKVKVRVSDVGSGGVVEVVVNWVFKSEIFPLLLVSSIQLDPLQ